MKNQQKYFENLVACTALHV